MSASLALTPLESLCFEQVTFWVGVVARNNGKSGRVVAGTPWTRLPAKDLVANLTERLPLLFVTVRQVRAALRRLVELGLVVREQFWLPECLRSDYWYSLGTVPAEGTDSLSDQPATTPSETVTPCDLTGTREEPQPEPPSDQNGHPYLLNPTSTYPERTRRTDVDEQSQSQEPQPPASRVDGEGASTPPEPPAADLQPQNRPVTPVANSNPLAGLQGSVWDRINALSSLFDPRTVQPVSPRAVVVGNRTLHVSDGACAPLR